MSATNIGKSCRYPYTFVPWIHSINYIELRMISYTQRALFITLTSIFICCLYIYTYYDVYIYICSMLFHIMYIACHAKSVCNRYCLYIHIQNIHTLHYLTLHYSTLHYIRLDYIRLHYTSLHYITLHHITDIPIWHSKTYSYDFIHTSCIIMLYITCMHVYHTYIMSNCTESRIAQAMRKKSQAIQSIRKEWRAMVLGTKD